MDIIQNIMQEIGIDNNFYSCTKNNIEPYFDKIANYLFFKNVIISNENKFQLTEIEFYYYSMYHEDPFAHKHDLQKQFGSWYFHNSGIDFTFGNNIVYCGVLLRGMVVVGENSKAYHVEGPILLFDKLFKNLSLFQNNLIGIEKVIFPSIEKIHKAKRIGLKLYGENIEAKKDFIDLRYRYVIMPHLLTKNKLMQ